GPLHLGLALTHPHPQELAATAVSRTAATATRADETQAAGAVGFADLGAGEAAPHGFVVVRDRPLHPTRIERQRVVRARMAAHRRHLGKRREARAPHQRRAALADDE